MLQMLWTHQSLRDDPAKCSRGGKVEIMNVMRREVRYYEEEDKIATGKRIQEARKAAGVKAETFAGFIGISKTQLSRIENGTRTCTTDNLVMICQYLDVSSDELLFGKKDGDQSSEVKEILALCEGQPEYRLKKALEIMRIIFE